MHTHTHTHTHTLTHAQMHKKVCTNMSACIHIPPHRCTKKHFYTQRCTKMSAQSLPVHTCSHTNVQTSTHRHTHTHTHTHGPFVCDLKQSHCVETESGTPSGAFRSPRLTEAWAESRATANSSLFSTNRREHGRPLPVRLRKLYYGSYISLTWEGWGWGQHSLLYYPNADKKNEDRWDILSHCVTLPSYVC